MNILDRKNQTCAAAFVCAALAGCGDERVTWVAPDATAWFSPTQRWEVPDGGVAVVTNSGVSSISLLDLTTRRTIGTFPIGVVPLADNGPHHLGVNPAEGWFVTPLSFPVPSIASGPHASHGSAERPGILIKRSLRDFRLLGRVDVDANPGDMLLSPDTRRAYVSHFDLLRAQRNVGNRDAQRSNLIVIDTTTMQRTATVPLCVAAHGMALSPDGNTLYAACYGDDALAVVRFTNGQPDVRLVPIGSAVASNPTNPQYGPYSVTVAPDGSTVWVGCTIGDRGGLLIAFDTATGAFDTARSTRSLLGKPFFGAYSPDGATMLIPLQGRDGIARVRTGSPFAVMQQVAMTPEQCLLPHQISLGPDGLYYLVCEGRHGTLMNEPGHVLALNPDDLSVVARYPTDIYPDAIVFVGGRR